MPKSLTIEQFRGLIHEGKASDPLIFLESVMNGQDPRHHSDVYKLALDIDEFSEGAPSPGDWDELFDLIRRECKYYPVSLSESASAAKTMAEYLHAKRKSIEHNDGSNSLAQVEPLTDDEIRSFLKIYEEEF